MQARATGWAAFSGKAEKVARNNKAWNRNSAPRKALANEDNTYIISQKVEQRARARTCKHERAKRAAKPSKERVERESADQRAV